MGLNIALGDLDEKEKGAGNFGNFHHEDWWAGVKDKTNATATLGNIMDEIRQPAVDRKPIETYESLAGLTRATLLGPGLCPPTMWRRLSHRARVWVAAVVVRPCDVELVKRWMGGSGVKVASVGGLSVWCLDNGRKAVRRP